MKMGAGLKSPVGVPHRPVRPVPPGFEFDKSMLEPAEPNSRALTLTCSAMATWEPPVPVECRREEKLLYKFHN